ncbi:SWF or SNF family helicase [Streptomyces sp. NPDC058145]|uniref:SWIM zinc finger family protein n=1 Tax=Streptomyces sp. NPDC058145 TaxID=3346356 RepID=UPI0036E6C704
MSRYEHGHEGGPERTFAALPPARGRGFARTWWGGAWLAALEDAALEATAVKAGRRLARAGEVGAVTVRPGRVTAVVREPKGAAHRADVLLPVLSEREWASFVELAVEQAGHLAALLDGDLPSHLIEDAAIRGIELLPGLGELEPECDCGAWDHCGHTAALCHQVARLLDEDPFVLLLMRGRGESTFLRELHQRSTAPPDEPAEPGEPYEAEGVDAAEAWAAADILPALPALPAVPEAPGGPPSYDAGTAPTPAPDSAALRYLAGKTAQEAHRLLGQALGDGGPGERDHRALTAAEDVVRLADGAVPDAVTERLADGSGRGREGLATAVRAWRLGGAPALAVLDEEWQVQDATLARARAALDAAWEADERPSFRRGGNRWTVPDEEVQLRLGPDGRWWPYRADGGHWLPAGAPDRNPATALATARLSPEARTPRAPDGRHEQRDGSWAAGSRRT